MNTALISNHWTNTPPCPDYLTGAEKTTWKYSTPDGADRLFRQKIFNRLPSSLATGLAKSYTERAESQGLAAANRSLLKTTEVLDHSAAIRLHSGFTELKDYARSKAKACERYKTRQAMNRICLNSGIKPPDKRYSDIGATKRMTDPVWWQRRLKKDVLRRFEAVSIHACLVNKRKAPYLSDYTFRQVKENVRQNRLFLESIEATNELGDSFTLAELHDKSIGNLTNRRSELMCRIYGMEKLAKEIGYVADFYTLTCPSRMHACVSASGDQNPKYDGTTPVEAQRYLTKLFSQIRAAYTRRGLEIFGLRVVEPHHDETPHWHILVFIHPDQQPILRKLFKGYALKESPDEPGAQKYRFKYVEIDSSKGSATGYIIKYISKNIDGHGVDLDSHGNKASEAAERIQAWKTTWGIRQFQFFGGPPVGVWRELRRIDYELIGDLEDARQAADAGDWCSYVKGQGGPFVSRESLRIRTFSKWSDLLGRYGEPIGDQLLGITNGVIEIVTRLHEWIFSKRAVDCAPLEYCQ